MVSLFLMLDVNVFFYGYAIYTQGFGIVNMQYLISR